MKDLLLSELQKIFLRKKAKSKIKILWSQNHKWIGRNKKSSLKLPFLGDGADTVHERFQLYSQNLYHSQKMYRSFSLSMNES